MELELDSIASIRAFAENFPDHGVGGWDPAIAYNATDHQPRQAAAGAASDRLQYGQASRLADA